MGFYDKYILPTFLNCACGAKPILYQRGKVVPLAEGLVLEVGIGSGLNIPFYDVANVQKVIGLDPSPELNDMASKVAANAAQEKGLSAIQNSYSIRESYEIHNGCSHSTDYHHFSMQPLSGCAQQ